MIKIKQAIIVVFITVGVILILYPTISDLWNQSRQSKVIHNYISNVIEYDRQEIINEINKANEYNKKLSALPHPLLNWQKLYGYDDILNLAQDGVMGYIEIPKLKIKLPIYHGTSEGALSQGCGHINGTSLPVGGKTTHCVLTSHCGMPSSKLFTDLDQLKVGDYFSIIVLEQKLIYKVDNIVTVKPDQIQDIKIIEGNDYCTLATCTPYGINTHRLLVRGTRASNKKMLDCNTAYILRWNSNYRSC